MTKADRAMRRAIELQMAGASYEEVYKAIGEAVELHYRATEIAEALWGDKVLRPQGSHPDTHEEWPNDPMMIAVVPVRQLQPANSLN